MASPGGGFLVLLALLSVGCGDLPGPDEGSVQIHVQDRLESEATSRTSSIPTPATNSAANSGDIDLEASVGVTLGFEERRSVDLGRARTVRFQLGSGGTDLYGGPRKVPVGEYNWSRLVLEGLQVTVPAGSIVNGDTVSKEIVLTPRNDVPVSTRVDVPSFTVLTGTPVRITFALNSAAWLTPDAVASSALDADLVARSVEVGISFR